MVIIGVMITMITRVSVSTSHKDNWDTVLREFNVLASIAKQESIATGKTHRITVHGRKEQAAVVEQEESNPAKPSKVLFKQLKSPYFETSYALPKSISVEHFYIGHEEQFSNNKNIGSCYVVGNGLADRAMLHVARKNPKTNIIESRATFLMNQFAGIFEMHRGFAKPPNAKKK